MAKTNIGWSDEVWNPVTGCSVVSPGCDHCYAHELSIRRGWSKKPWTARNAAENVVLHPDRLDYPLHWRKPRMVFVNSMSDLFHELIPFEFIDMVFAVMAITPQHTYQILTKRPKRMLEYMSQVGLPGAVAAETGSGCDGTRNWPFIRPDDLAARWPLSNVWLGVSVEDQRRAVERIPILLDTPAAVRWISAEPLLGPIHLDPWWVAESTVDLAAVVYGGIVRHPNVYPALDWAVVGGESGPQRRRMDIEWVREIVEQCDTTCVPVFVKQDSGRFPGKQGKIPDWLWAYKQFPRQHASVR